MSHFPQRPPRKRPARPGPRKVKPLQTRSLTATLLPRRGMILNENDEALSCGIAVGSHKTEKANTGLRLPVGPRSPPALRFPPREAATCPESPVGIEGSCRVPPPPLSFLPLPRPHFLSRSRRSNTFASAASSRGLWLSLPHIS